MILLAALLFQAGADEEWEAVWFSDDLAYRHYLADPRAPHTGSRLQFPIRKEDHLKIENVLGGHRSVLRYVRKDETFEFEAEAAAFSRFDVNETWDMDGIDYRFGFPFVYRAGGLGLKLHPWHLTSHLGDEFEEREGRLRIKYARNELALGVSWWPREEFRFYVEGGWGFVIGSPNDPWRWQAGSEIVAEVLGAGAPEVYAGINLTSFQEIDWDVVLTVQSGLWIRPELSPRGFRVGLEYFRGHSALTQFFQEIDHYWSLGVWMHW